jgi:hypothetical protein
MKRRHRPSRGGRPSAGSGINPTQVPACTGVPSTTVIGAPRPAPLFNTTDFWAQGVNFGLELRF